VSFLLDTSVISELVKKSPHGPVLKWIDDQDEALLYLSVITIGELEKGIARLSASARRNRLHRGSGAISLRGLASGFCRWMPGRRRVGAPSRASRRIGAGRCR